MGSPGCTAHLPFYVGPSNSDTAMHYAVFEQNIKQVHWSGVYMPRQDRLALEENPCVPMYWTVDLSPPTETQSQDSTSETEIQAEEQCLEQLQTMVVGEVLKDVDMACKLLNITPGTDRNALD